MPVVVTILPETAAIVPTCEMCAEACSRVTCIQVSVVELLLQAGVQGAQCIIDDEPRSGPRPCGILDPTLCGSRKVTFSAAIVVQPESGPVCLLGSEAQQRICWEILIAGAEQGLEAGQVGLRLVVKGAGQTTSVKVWNIGSTSLADGR